MEINGTSGLRWKEETPIQHDSSISTGVYCIIDIAGYPPLTPFDCYSYKRMEDDTMENQDHPDEASPSTITFESLPSTFFQTLSSILLGDRALKTLSSLNVTCKSVRVETSAQLWRKLEVGGSYDWATHFDARPVKGHPSMGRMPYFRMMQYVRYVL